MVAQFLRPDADQSDGSWLNEAASNTNLFASVDETSLSDTDFMQSSTTDGDKVRLRLSDPSSGVVAPLIVRYRCKRTGTQAANLIGRLFQGTSPGTQIATWTQLGVSDTFTTYTYTLTSGEFASITDFTDLYVEFELSQQASLKVDLNFAGGVYYDSGTVADATGVLSCTRASTGYAKNADGTLTSFSSNQLRIGVGSGLLVEDARTNIKARSQEFDNATEWNTVVNTTITANATTAPDGTTTADSLVPTVTSGEHKVGSNAGVTTAAKWTASCYFKPNGYNFAAIAIQNTTFDSWWVFDLVAGTATRQDFGSAPTGVTLGFEVLANGWVRPSITMDASANNFNFTVGVVDQSTYHTFAGNGTSGIFAWGAQVELGAFPSSYVPTASTSASRAADSITISGNAQTTIAAATGSIVAQIGTQASTSFAANIVDSNGTNVLGFNASNNALASLVATLATGNTANRNAGDDKLGLAWSGAGRSIVLNGGTVATDASAQTPSSTQSLGSANATSNFIYAYVERLTLFNSKVVDATLQGYTR